MTSNLHREILAEVRRDIDRLATELEELRAVERYHTGKAGEEAEEEPPDEAQPAEEMRPENGKAKPYAKMTVRDAAKDVLEREGDGPLSTRVITDKLLAGGYPTKNANQFRNAVFGVLNKNTDIFKKVGVGLWQLRPESERPKKKEEEGN